MKNLLFLAVLLFSTVATLAQTAQVTFLHNAADPAIAVVDLYVTQSGVTTKVEDIAFQTTNSLGEVFIFGDIDVTFSVAPSNSGSEAEKILTYTFKPAADAGYIVMAQGVRSASGFAANPDGKSIEASMSHFEVPLFAGTPNQTGLLFAHGATDLEKGDIYARGNNTVLKSGLTYSENTTVLTNVTTARTTFDFTKAGNKANILASFEVDLPAYSSETVVLVLSGFKTPGDNNGATTPLALLAILENGTVVKNDLVAGSQTARVQMIHNAADPGAALVDIWVDGVKAVDNFGFRKATPFRDLPAGSPIVIGFAPPTSTTYKDTIKTVTIPALRPGRSYHIVAHGVMDTTKFAQNPDGRDVILQIVIIEGALEKSDEPGKTAVRASHGVTDAGTVSIVGRLATYASNIGFSDITSVYTNVAPETDTLWLVDPTTQKPIRGWVADLKGTDRATVVLASGFVTPDSNNAGPAFKLILVDANGNVNDRMVEVEPTVNSVNEEGLVPSGLWSMMPNPATDQFTLSLPLTNDLVAVHGASISAQV
ncbi:MAG: DUF4397 domain-containing protein, partial [Ignavibacteriae bacterium]